VVAMATWETSRNTRGRSRSRDQAVWAPATLCSSSAPPAT
jgi:hypothetical protein